MTVNVRQLLLLSGGVDSTALAALHRPELSLTIDYGQRPAAGEIRAAAQVASLLGIEHRSITVDASVVGAGVLMDDSSSIAGSAPETWPMRNQLLVTVAAAYALRNDFGEVLLGIVRQDRNRHQDGTPEFVELVDRLTAWQEGGIRVRAPGIEQTAAELVVASQLGQDFFA
ncbi:MAG: 7-cyano-7-deazaguanine synthase [bacterium]|nr:7-cyano-7-deazaguanine synthase [bacterium]